jgi:hypothetical protein
MTPSDFGFFSDYTLLGSAARGKRENLTIYQFDFVRPWMRGHNNSRWAARV